MILDAFGKKEKKLIATTTCAILEFLLTANEEEQSELVRKLKDIVGDEVFVLMYPALASRLTA